MQFSILGVPFKCTKDMFTWEKVKWTLCVFLAHWWRQFLVGYLLILSFAIVAGGISVVFDALKMPLALDEGQALILMGALYVPVLLILLRIDFYVLFKKKYKSFDRHFFNPPQQLRFFSGLYWKPFLAMTLLVLMCLCIVGLVSILRVVFLGGMFGVVLDILSSLLSLVVFFVYLVLISGHVTLHGGAWGFVPVWKQPRSDISEAKI